MSASAARRDERGAVAVLTAMVAVSLLLICALVVDLGLARDTKRDSQNAADASALAAANALWPGTATCLDGSTTPPCYADAVVKAKNYAAVNFGVTESDWSGCSDGSHFYVPSGTPQCISFTDATFTSAEPTVPTNVRVVVPTRTVTTGFGNLAGVSSVSLGTHAVAGFAKPSAGGLRPWGVCSEQLPGSADTEVTMIFLPGNGHTSTHGCSASNAGGNWWLMKCPEDGNGGTPQTAANVLDGCEQTVSPVPNQPVGNTLADFLIDACPGRSEHCLGGDTGNNLKVFADEWQTLVGQTITMPVFCDQPQCTSSTLTGTGTTAIYPIWKMVSVEICGFSLNGDKSTDWPASPDPCSTKNLHGYSPNEFGKKEDGFLVVFRTLDKPLVSVDSEADPPNLVE